MEQDPERDPSYTNPQLEPTAGNETENLADEAALQAERDAEAADDALKAAIDHIIELRQASARDHHFDDEYNEALDAASRLLAERRPQESPSDNSEQSPES